MNKPSITFWRPATVYYLIGGLVLLLIGSVISYILSTFQPTLPLRIGSGMYSLWVADTNEERTKGLAGVAELKPNQGMILKYDTDSDWGIWMKDMETPIDIIWVNNQKRVVYIVKNALPELGEDVIFRPKEKARYVIELPAGSVENAGIRMHSLTTFDETSAGSMSW